MFGQHEAFKAVLGVSGADCPILGSSIIRQRLEQNGVQVTGPAVTEDHQALVAAAKSTAADAILISCSYGQGETACRGLRALCEASGLKGITLYAGGNLMAADPGFAEVERTFRAIGFDRVFPPLVSLALVAEQLKEDIRRKRRSLKGRIAGPARFPNPATPAGLNLAFAHMYG